MAFLKYKGGEKALGHRDSENGVSHMCLQLVVPCPETRETLPEGNLSHTFSKSIKSTPGGNITREPNPFKLKWLVSKIK